MYLFKLLFLYSSDMYPQVGLLYHMVTLFLVFEEFSILFSIVAAPIYIPTNSAQRISFLHIIANICVLFDDSHSDWCEVVSHCGLFLVFFGIGCLHIVLFIYLFKINSLSLYNF